MKLGRLAAVAVLTWSVSARAENCAPIAGAAPELATISGEERLSYIRNALARDARNMLWWSAIYGTAYLGTTSLSLGEALTSHTRGDRIDNYTGTAASFIGLGLITMTPKKVLLDHPRLEREIKKGGEVCRLVADAERLLMRDAADEAFGTGLLTQAGNFGFNMAIGAMLVGLGRYKEAAIITFSGIGVGEIMIISQPVGAVKTLQMYRDGAMGLRDLEPSKPKMNWALLPQFSRQSAGLNFALKF